MLLSPRLPRSWSALVVSWSLAALACAPPEVGQPGGGASGGSRPGPGSGPGGPGDPGAGGASGSAGQRTGGSTFVLPDASPTIDGTNAGQPEKCAEEGHVATPVPVDLLLLVDKSGSMNDAGEGTVRSKWHMVREALVTFINDPMSAGLGVGMVFFPYTPPHKPCTNTNECTGLGGSSICIVDRRCRGPNIPAGLSPMCGPNDSCQQGATCQRVGRCAKNGMACDPVGSMCMREGGECVAVERICNPASISAICGQAEYEKITTPIATLPAAAPALIKRLESITPSGGTPMGPAVQGALAHLRAHLAANPGRNAALVVVGDGLPESCPVTDAASIGGYATAARMGTPTISTYVIGVFGLTMVNEARTLLEALSTGGGTGMPFVLRPAEDLTQRFIEALNQIRGSSLPCEFMIPPPKVGSIDYGKVNLVFTTATGSTDDILYVERMDRCDPVRGGWYYDVNPAMGTPRRVVVCPATCQRFKTEMGAKVDLRFGCRTRVVP